MHRVPRSSSGMKTVSTALLRPTSNSHLRVPSVERCSAATRGATMAQRSPSWRRNSRARSVMWSNESSPRWCIQRCSCLARNGLPPHCATRSRSSGPPRPRRFTGSVDDMSKTMARFFAGCGLTAVNVAFGKEESDFDRGGLGSVGAMDGIGIDAVGKVGADGARLGLLGVGGAHQVAVLLDGVVAFEHLDED